MVQGILRLATPSGILNELSAQPRQMPQIGRTMTKQANLQRIRLFVVATLAFLLIRDIEAAPQKKDYKPGEKIEYRSSSYPEVWEAATFIRATPDGTQPIIRQMPTEFSKDGFQRATSWAEIRPSGATKPTYRREPEAAQPKVTGERAETARDLGRGLMSQADVLRFLRTRFGDKPFANPRREELKQELAEMIKARGLDFRYSTSLTEFNSQLGKYGMTSEVVFPLRDNFGPPTKRNWLMGAWQLGKIGTAVDYVKDNRVYRQGEIGVANVGTLRLNGDGSYAWKTATKNVISGQWRIATGAEMRSQGGDGIVLLKAKGGYDWIVTKDRNTTLKGEWINISELGTRQIREYGSRGGTK